MARCCQPSVISFSGFRGTGDISFESAVTAVMIEGAIFLFLALTGLRYAVARLIPEPVRDATPAAIGAFLAHLGLQTANGIGLVVSDVATAVTIGGCPLEKRTYMTSLTDACTENIFSCVTSDAYTCDDNGGIMTSGTTWLGIGGLVLILIFMAYKYVLIDAKGSSYRPNKTLILLSLFLLHYSGSDMRL